MINPHREWHDLEQLRQAHDIHARSCARRRERNDHAKAYARTVKALRSWTASERRVG